MDNMYISAIAIFGFNFSMRGWAFCNGQVISIAQNTAVFALLGTTYGGNGQTTFGLPDLRGRVPIGAGQGPGLSDYSLGEVAGQENVTLLSTQMPSHNHTLAVNNTSAIAEAPVSGSEFGVVTDVNGDGQMLYNSTPPNVSLFATTIGLAGGGQPHENMQPYLGLNFCICMEGVFPSRN